MKRNEMIFEEFPGKKGRKWLVRKGFPAGWKNDIYCSDPRDRSGFGGALQDFNVAVAPYFVNIKSYVGPWHSNADAFLKDTGLQVPA